MKKLTKIVVGVIVLIVIAALIYVLFFEKAQAPQNNWVSYTDVRSDVSIQAPAGLTLASTTNGLSLIFATTTPYVHTHLLHELRIDIDLPMVDCAVRDAGPAASSTFVAINGLNFEREKWSDVGAGNIYQGVDYTVVRNGLCYRISLFTHSTNGEGFYGSDPAQIQKIDALQVMDIKNLFALFDQIVGTIKFTK